jgi:hypothetical protein
MVLVVTKIQKDKNMKTFNYLAKNKITGLYFDGDSFKADRANAKIIDVNKAFFKLVWNYNDNLELIDLEN